MKKTVVQRSRSCRAFSLVEMIGVLAVVGILAALLLPRIISSIGIAQVTASTAAITTVKNALTTYYGRFGRYGTDTGLVITATNDPAALDWGNQVLLKGGYIEKAFRAPIAKTSVVRLRSILSDTTAATTNNAAYNLDGLDPVNDARQGRWVVEAYLTGVANDDAVQLNLQLDGAASTLAADITNRRDTTGRVKFDAAQSVTDVLIYLSHR